MQSRGCFGSKYAIPPPPPLPWSPPPEYLRVKGQLIPGLGKTIFLTVDPEKMKKQMKIQIMMKYGFGTLNNDVWTMKNLVLITKTNENL